MLARLSIRDIVLIDQLDLEFVDGLPAQKSAEQTAETQDMIEMPVR